VIRIKPGIRACAAIAVLAGASSTARAQQTAITPGLAIATFDTAWARIDRTFYDTVFLATRWKVLRDSLRPIAAKAKTNNELRAVLQTLISGVGVSHFGLIPSEVSPAVGDIPAVSASASSEKGTIGAFLRLAGAELVIWKVDSGGPAWRAGLRPGMPVKSIGETPISDEIAKLARITDAEVRRQARVTAVMRANALLAGNRGDTIALGVVQRGKAGTMHIVRGPVRGQMYRFGNLPPLNGTVDVEERTVDGRRIGVLTFSVWLAPMARDIDLAFDRMRNCDGIVIDLRGNPGGLGSMVTGVAGHLLDSAYMIGTLRQRTQQLAFRANPRRVSSDSSHTAVHPYAGPVAILMDPLSGSTSEFFAAGLQGLGRARIIGEQSAGRALPALMDRLPNDDVLMHVIADLTDSRGRRVEGPGVIPDVHVPLSVKSLEAGKDDALDAALRWAASQPRSIKQD
jgi:carboxyl-terminal processing protease